jgi:hypothetical protein
VNNTGTKHPISGKLLPIELEYINISVRKFILTKSTRGFGNSDRAGGVKYMIIMFDIFLQLE